VGRSRAGAPGLRCPATVLRDAALAVIDQLLGVVDLLPGEFWLVLEFTPRGFTSLTQSAVESARRS
jgi:hypothetical protein